MPKENLCIKIPEYFLIFHLKQLKQSNPLLGISLTSLTIGSMRSTIWKTRLTKQIMTFVLSAAAPMVFF